MNRGAVVVFAGPSVTAQAARTIGDTGCEVVFRPPVQQGDVIEVLRHEPRVIAIVDGFFFQVPSVTHKEILLALARGTRVLGSSSMGALRAAELNSFGMEGIGEVFEMYRSGAVEGDDEVALVYGPAEEGYPALTEPLVGVRYNLAAAVRQGALPARTARAVIRSARAVHFSRRTVAAVLDAAARVVPENALDVVETFLTRRRVDVKAHDAAALLHAITRRLGGTDPWPTQPSCAVNETVYLHLLRRQYEGTRRSDVVVSDAMVTSFYKLLDDEAPESCRRVRTRCLAVEEAALQGIDPAPLDDLVASFRARHGVDEGMTEWLSTRCLDRSELELFLTERGVEQGIVGLLERRFRGRPPEDVLQELAERRTGLTRKQLTGPPFQRPGIPWEGIFQREVKMSGGFARTLEIAADITALAGRLDADLPGLRACLSRERLEAWSARSWGGALQSFEDGLLARGFSSYREWLDVAADAFLFETARRSDVA